VVPEPQLAPYRVKRLLGQGGFGAVFEAERIADGQLVAIKVARSDNASAGDSLMREATALSAVGLPHVPAVYDAGKLPDGSVYVVMEFVRAPILGDRMAMLDGPMPMDEFARDALAMLAVIEAAHDKGLVHCDLKPENVFVDDSFGAKLFDFGRAQRLPCRGAERRRRVGSSQGQRRWKGDCHLFFQRRRFHVAERGPTNQRGSRRPSRSQLASASVERRDDRSIRRQEGRDDRQLRRLRLVHRHGPGLTPGRRG
jgi:serine/threonine protein kinase